jgi:hypothetical protein
MLVILLALCLVLAACASDSDSSDNDDTTTIIPPQYDDPLIFSGKRGGKTVTVTISQTDPSKAVLTPKAGDSYGIRLVNTVISTGKIAVNGSAWIFTPSSDSSGTKTPFNATYYKDNNTLFFPILPDSDFTNLIVSANGSNTSTGNNGNDGDNSLPGIPVLTGTVSINNTSPVVGDTLTAEYTGNGTGTATWQWLRGNTEIYQANSNVYVVGTADEGKTLKASVSFANQSGSITSAPTNVVSSSIK